MSTCLCDALDYELEGPCLIPGHDSRVHAPDERDVNRHYSVNVGNPAPGLLDRAERSLDDMFGAGNELRLTEDERDALDRIVHARRFQRDSDRLRALVEVVERIATAHRAPALEASECNHLAKIEWYERANAAAAELTAVRTRVHGVLASTEWACDDGHKHEWGGSDRLVGRISVALVGAR